MRTDQSERLRRAVHELASAVPVPEIEPAALRARAAASRRRPRPASARWLPALAAAATLLIVAAVALLPGAPPRPGDEPGADRGVAVLPVTFADHSYLTAHVSAAPAGPAVALYEYGIGDLPWQTPQAIVIGADGRRYREIEAAGERGHDDSGGPWPHLAPTLLSPDGRKVAVEWTRGPATDDIAVVDLVTGRTRHYPVGAGATVAVQVLAWSPDSARLAYAAGTTGGRTGADPATAIADTGTLHLLDLASGSVTPLPGLTGILDAAFSPDGSRLAVQTTAGLRIAGPDGPTERVDVPAGYRLAGPAAWSPDGSQLGLYRIAAGSPGQARGHWSPDGLAVLRLGAGGTTAVVDTDLQRLLGWRAGEVVVHRGDEIAQVPIGGGPGRRLARLQPGDDHFVNGVQLATRLLPDLQVRKTGVDRGPWPRWLRLLVVAGVPGTVLLLGWGLRRWRRKHPADRAVGAGR